MQGYDEDSFSKIVGEVPNYKENILPYIYMAFVTWWKKK